MVTVHSFYEQLAKGFIRGAGLPVDLEPNGTEAFPSL